MQWTQPAPPEPLDDGSTSGTPLSRLLWALDPLRGGRGLTPARHSGTRGAARHSPVGAGAVDIPLAGHRRRHVVVLRGAGLGRVLELGSGRERLGHALAGDNGIPALAAGPGAP